MCSSCDTSHEFDIKTEGGIEYILEVSADDFLLNEANRMPDKDFMESMNNIRKNKSLRGGDFIKAFIQEYSRLAPGRNFAFIFERDPNDRITSKTSKDELEKELIEKYNFEVERMAEIVKNRLEKFGVEKYNVIKIPGGVKIEIGGEFDEKRIEKVIAAHSNFGLYETYEGSEIWIKYLNNNDSNLIKTLREFDTVHSLNTSQELLSGQLLHPPVAQDERRFVFLPGPMVGRAKISDTLVINQYLQFLSAGRMVPADLQFCWSLHPIAEDENIIELYAIKSRYLNLPVISGAQVQDAHAERNEKEGNAVVNFTLTVEGARMFDELTQKNIHRSIAILLDRAVVSAPRVESRIAQGNANITGNFSMEEATDLATILSSGTSAVKGKIISKKKIKP